MHRRNFLKAAIAGLVVPVTRPPQQEWVTLRITPQEAQALANVVTHVGGDPYLSDRGHIDTINSLLWEQGYSYQWGNVTKHTIMDEDGTERFHYNTLTLRNYSEYQHTHPPGPGRKFTHSPELRYLRRQRDGVIS